MSSSKTDRREFLSLTAASLAGLAIAAGAASLPAGLITPAAAERKPLIEEWLLGTGRATLGPAVYDQTLQMIYGPPPAI